MKAIKKFLKFILFFCNQILKFLDLKIVRHSKYLYYLANTDLNSIELCNKFGLEVRSILHIGANTAQEARWYSTKGISSAVFIEADPLIYVQMMERLKLYPNFTGINACLSKDFGTVDFYQASNNGASSSILKPHRHLNHYPEVAFKKPIKLESVPLDSLNLGRFDLIVMDVQGAEHLVIEGGVKQFALADAIYLECNSGNLYKLDTDLNSIVKLLDKDFTLASAIMNTFQIGDALFIRRQIIDKLLAVN